MKAHIGVDADSGVTHSVETSTAKLHDSQVWVDKGYVSAEREAACRAPSKVWGVMRKAPNGGELHPVDEQINCIIAMVRAQLFTLFALGNLLLVRRRLAA